MTIEESKLSPTTTKLNHVYTYIHTYMEKRANTRESIRTNVVFYDAKDLNTLKMIAFQNNSNVSSIISNLIREFNLLCVLETPQKTLFNFEETPKLHFDTSSKEALGYLMTLSKKDFKAWARQLQMWMDLEQRVASEKL